jgi:phytoene synthase
LTENATRPTRGRREIAVAVRDVGRDWEPDRYLAALLAPAEIQADLAAIAAFSGELRKIAQSAREPLVGQIKLQWWRDALARLAAGEASGHPVGEELAETARRRALPWAELGGLIDAHESMLLERGGISPPAGNDPMQLAETIVFRLGLIATGVPSSETTEAVVTAASRVYALARLQRPRNEGGDASNSDVERRTLARKHLADARRRANALGSRALPVFLPLVMVEPYLRVQERGEIAEQRQAGVLPMRRAWRIWRAHLLRRV